jgi:AcrR family transcriptional regulator
VTLVSGSGLAGAPGDALPAAVVPTSVPSGARSMTRDVASASRKPAAAHLVPAVRLAGSTPVSYERMNEPVKPHSVLTEPPIGDTPSRLIAGTLRTLKARGLAGTTSRAIASESGVNLGGITYHFGSKDELVAQALLVAIRGWIDPALEALRQEAPAAVRMMEAVRALQDSFERARDLLPVYLEALVHANRSDSLRRGVVELLNELRGFLAEQITELRSTGFLPAWVDPPAMASLLLATGDGLSLHAAMDPESIDQQAVAGQAVQVLLAVSAQPPPSR